MKKIVKIGIVFGIICILVIGLINFYTGASKEIINYDMTKVTETMEIKDDDGVTLINVKYSYPVIKNKDKREFVDNINNEYKFYTDTFIKEAEESKEDAKDLREMLEEGFAPFTRELDYNVNMNKNGLLSITNNAYYYSGGAHGSYVMTSRTFDINVEQELKLEDIINNNEWNIKENTHKLFNEKLQNDGLDLNDIWGEVLKEEIDNVNFYVKDGALVLYFNAEQVASYALGAPTVEVPYDENIFLIDISNNDESTLVKVLTPTGFAGSSLNRIALYQNGDVYWIQYDGQGIGEENILHKILVASNAKDIEMFEEEGINVVGDDVKIASTVNVTWLSFNK